MIREDPSAAFTKAVSRLNGKNLFDLWTVSCILSSIEYFDSWNNRFNFLFPTIHAEKVALFHRAILDSKSADYKQNLFTARDVPYVFNALNEATSERTVLLAGHEDPTVRIRRLLSTMAHQQIRLQESNFLDRLGRTYAMLHDIPLNHREELRQKMGDGFIDLTIEVKDHLGLSVTEFLVIGYTLIALSMQKYQANIKVSDEIRRYTTEQRKGAVKRRADVIRNLVETSREIRNNFTFKTQDLVIADSAILTPTNVQTYLDLLARSTRQLRDLAKQEAVYSEGLIPDRLSPLERYPIVALDNSRYIIPNLRHFDTATTDVIHYVLQEKYPDNLYNQLRGYTQEIYLHLLLHERLPDVKVIPEVSYRKAKNRVDGPDLTVTDPVNQTLIAVESKAKRMRVVSRVHPGTTFLIEDLQGALAAFEKLPGKIQDLYAGIPEYAMYQTDIDATRNNIAIAVVVLGEGVYFINELLNDYIRSDTQHFLNSYTMPYCLMRIEVFERAVEISASNNTPLHELLREHWTKSKSTNISEASAEAFAPHPTGTPTFTQRYAQRFFDEFIKGSQYRPAASHAHGVS